MGAHRFSSSRPFPTCFLSTLSSHRARVFDLISLRGLTRALIAQGVCDAGFSSAVARSLTLRAVTSFVACICFLVEIGSSFSFCRFYCHLERFYWASLLVSAAKRSR